MFQKKSTPPAVDTLVGEHTAFTGNIETEGSVKILGKVEGDIRANGDVHLEASARIQGQIFGASIFIAGRVDGNVTAKALLHLQSTARLFGDIEVGSMVTDEGGRAAGCLPHGGVPRGSGQDRTGRRQIKTRRAEKKQGRRLNRSLPSQG